MKLNSLQLKRALSAVLFIPHANAEGEVRKVTVWLRQLLVVVALACFGTAWGQNVAQVSNDGTNWTSFEQLITGNSEIGAFNYANTLTGDVVIELLTSDTLTLTSGITFNKSGMTSLTIRTADVVGARSILEKNQTSASMFTVTSNVGSLTVENVFFDGGGNNGYSGTNGGIFNIASSSVTITDCDFQHSWVSSKNGGAIYYKKSGGSVALYGCVFNDCKAPTGTSSGTGNGGGIYISEGSTLTVNRSTKRRSSFEGCVANRYGGALINDDNNALTVSVQHTDFTDCSATRESGGAILSDAKGSSGYATTIDDCSFTNCSGKYGGAVVSNYDNYNLSNNTNSISNSIFNNCSASSDGGAICSKSTQGHLIISNCTISGCSATTTGGAVYTAGNTLTLRNNVSVTGNTIGNNNVNNGAGIYIDKDTGGINIEDDGEGANITVYDNFTSDDQRSDIKTGINVVPCFEITASSLTGQIGVANAGVYNLWLGRSTVSHVCGDPIQNVFHDDADIYPTIEYRDGEQKHIYWGLGASTTLVCKVTDAEGNMLYYGNNGSASPEAVFYSLAEVFAVCQEASNSSFTNADGTAATPANIEMLVPTCSQIGPLHVPDMTMTLKTAGINPPDGKYPGPGSNTVITRDGFTNSMFIMNNNENFTLTDITINGDSVTCGYNGGIIRMESANCQLHLEGGVVLKNGMTAKRGGAVYVYGDAAFSMAGATIEHCFANMQGGAVYIASGNNTANTIENSTFSYCTSATGGGAIYSGKRINLRSTAADNVTLFDHCSAQGSGGAVLMASTICLDNNAGLVSFSDCSTSGTGRYEGGAVYIKSGNGFSAINNGGNIQFMNCSVSGYSDGGAIRCMGFLTLKCVGDGMASFENCDATDGGGAISGTTNSIITIEGTTANPVQFVNCAVQNIGGAIYSGISSIVNITNCTIEGCSAVNGGGAIWIRGNSYLTNCNISSCVSQNNEAVCVVSGEGFVTGCLIGNNQGTGLDINGSATINNCDIVHNGSKGLVLHNATNTITNSILWGNGESNIHYQGENLDASIFSYCAIEGGHEGNGNVNLASENDGADNLNYVRFMSVTNNDFQLRSNSSCVNVGDSSVLPSDALDLAGHPRVVDGRIDIGCYEYYGNVFVEYNIEDEICFGEDYIQNGFEIIQPESGINEYSLTLQTYNGQDSIVDLTLLVHPSYFIEEDTVVCGVLSYHWHSNTYTESGMYYDSLQTVYGCDSIYLLSLEFCPAFPELHVTGISHSALVAGQQATISWTVQNDGTAPTPNGATWNDYVWLSVESSVNTNFGGGLLLLGTFENISALNVGESYTQTQTFNIPIDISGDYYLFVLTDVYDAWLINWENNIVPDPYNPPPYISCYSRNNGVIYELSEYEHGYDPMGYFNDNFFYELVDIEVPLVPDLQVTSIIPPDNFFSGTNINVLATISNLGEVTTLTDHWTDALYYSQEPDFNTATCLATVSHSGALPVDSSYQVTFTGYIPLTVYGEAYFFVKTDIYEQVYEHIYNHNNVMMSDAVNIILTPPADLEPSELVVPVAVSTAENLSYSFKVTNVGAGNPNVTNWVDKVYISTEDTFGTNAIWLKTHYHYGNLAPTAYYSIDGSVALPYNVNSGFYYLYVVTDADDAVFEYLFEDNNILQSSLISVTSPDLQITEMTAPEQITSGYPINLSYTLINNGDGAVTNRYFTDNIYISTTSSLNGAIQIATLRHNVSLHIGQSVTFSCTESAPANLTDGTYHLFVVTDANSEIHESNENNNIFSQYPMPVMHQPLPDLQPVSLNLPTTVQAGEAVSVDFDITNLGDLDLLNSNCTFNVYALQNGYEILCPVQSQTLPLGSNVSIGIGQTVHFVRSILMPASVTSACTTFKLYADKENRVVESNENNNTITANASVIDCPLPDLTVSNFTLPTLQAGTEAQVSFTVSNQGTADFSGSFGTSVYVNANGTQILCPLKQQIVPETTTYSLAVGESLQFTLKVLVPPTVTSACTSFSVKVDEANAVLEANEYNNSANGNATVTDYPFNLTTQTFTVPSSVTAGEATSISWTVKNNGTCPNGQLPFYLRNGGSYTLVEGEYLPTPWKDKVYLSDDATLSNNDIQLLAIDHNMVLQPNGTYSVEQTVTLPYSAIGSKYLLCVSDATELTFDNNRTDNIVAVPIQVELGMLPDLHITALTVEPVMTSDNAYWVHYTVTNEGERVTQRDNWMDVFYISENYTVVGAFQLGSKIHYGALEVGASYTDSIEIFVPNGLEGNYFLLGLTDATNLVFENTNESNNLLGITVTVVAPDPCDLIAIQPEFPNYVVSGEEMTVSWQLRNIGANPAVGRVRNAVYLSTDAAWSSDDKMLGYGNIDINLAANAQQTCSLSGMLTSVPEGHYYVFVKANILNALNESSYENNICVSMLTTEVGYPTLAIGEQVDRSLATDQYIYYKLQVGPEYEGQTLSCTLTTAEEQVANGIYLSHEAVPTLSQYDFGQYAPYAQEIEILIPALEQGDYYLLVKGSTQSGSSQQVSIATAIINFEILHVDADHGANSGSITTKVTGAKFDSIMDFRLVQGGEYLPAEKVFFSNSTETYTTFDLVDMPAGTYAMEAELPGGIITIKGEAFTIEEGLPAELAVNIVAPSSVRRGNTFPVNIEYGNIGTTDLNVSGFVVVSRNGHPIGFTSDELAEGLTERVFSTAEDNGNPDVLRPGYRATKTILVDANTLTSVSLQVYAIRKQY